MQYEDEDDYLCEDNIADIQPVKSYIKTIREKTEFDKKLTSWVEQQITNISKRIHKVGINDITAYFIQGNALLECGYSNDHIFNVMGISSNSQRKKIIGLSQGQSRNKSAIAYSSVVVPLLITHPKVFLTEITEAFANRKGLEESSIEPLIRDINHFGDIMYDAMPLLKTYDPKCCACALVFFYTTLVYGKTGTLPITITKTEFKTMRFTNGERMGNVKDFDLCLPLITAAFNQIKDESDPDLISRVLYSPERLKERDVYSDA
jgi:hypothetical protein